VTTKSRKFSVKMKRNNLLCSSTLVLHRLSRCLSVCLSVYLSICLSTNMSDLSVCLALSIFLSSVNCLSIFIYLITVLSVFVYLSHYCLYFCLSVYLSLLLYVSIFLCLCHCPSLYLFICLLIICPFIYRSISLPRDLPICLSFYPFFFPFAMACRRR
jgi:hypothetical protein